MLQSRSPFQTRAKNLSNSPSPSSRLGRHFPPVWQVSVFSLLGRNLLRPVELGFIDPHAMQNDRELTPRTAGASLSLRGEGPHRFTQNDHGASYERYGVLQWWIRLKISFARFSASFKFRLLQQLSSDIQEVRPITPCNKGLAPCSDLGMVSGGADQAVGYILGYGRQGSIRSSCARWPGRARRVARPCAGAARPLSCSPASLNGLPTASRRHRLLPGVRCLPSRRRPCRGVMVTCSTLACPSSARC